MKNVGGKKKRVKNKKSIKTQLLFSYLSVGIVPIVIFAVISGIIFKRSMYNSEVNSLRQISSMVTENLDKWGDDNLLLVEDIATSQIVYSKDIEGIQSDLKNKQGQDTSIINIAYVDNDGNVLTDSLGSQNENIKKEEYFKGVTNGYTYVSDVIFDNENNTSFIVFSCPVKIDNQIAGYIVNKVKASSIGDSIGDIFYSENGEIFTFNSNGYITYHNDYSKIMNENILDSSSELSEGAAEALSGNFNNVNYTYNGESGVAVYNFIPSLKWGTITITPNSDVYKGFTKIITTGIPVISLIVVLIVVFVIYIVKYCTNQFSEVSIFMKNVSEGNLTVQCNLKGASEIVDISDNLNEMVKSLKMLVLSIHDKSNLLKDGSVELDNLASCAEENSRDISKAMNEISDSSVSQASKTEDVLNHVKNMNEKMNELECKLNETNDALKISDKALIKGNNGTKELRSTTEDQFKIVGQAVREVNELAQFVANIDTIIETISEIADQTSLLALNASIEAARAGESGKGFAVVAEEVAKLANESQKATKETASILNSIRNKADLTTQLMGSIDDGMKLQTNTVNETLNIFNEITNADNKIAENIQSFNSLLTYMKEFDENLLDLITTLASSAEESAAVSEEVTASSENQMNVVEKVKKSGDNILQIVDELKLNIDKFKTE